MPTRRASSSSGQPLQSAPAAQAASRGGHRSSESTHNYTSTSTFSIPNNQANGSMASAQAQHRNGSISATASQDKVVQTLINRLRSQLPCNAGTTIVAIENDEIMQQTVESIVQLTRHRRDAVALALSELLEKLTKITQPDAEGNLPIDILLSQLYILKVLTAALTQDWVAHRKAEIEESLRHPSSFDTKIPASDRWVDPPPLSSLVAKYTLSVMVLFLRQTSAVGDRPRIPGHTRTASFPDFQSLDLGLSSLKIPKAPPPPSNKEYTRSVSQAVNIFPVGKVIPVNPTIHAFQSKSMGVTGTTEVPVSAFLISSTSFSTTNSESSISWLIAQYASRLVFHLSVSNWHVVFARIRNKIHHLASTSEDNADIIDMKLMSHTALDRTRLVQVLQELSSLLVNMKKETQTSVSIALRAAIWRWIEVFPHEFVSVVLEEKDKKLDGVVERVYDMLFGIAQNASQKAFWPTLTALFVSSPERFRQAASSRGPRGKATFLEMLSKALSSSSKLYEVSITCIVDICKAASSLPADSDCYLGVTAPELANDLRIRLFRPTQPQRPFWDTDELIDIPMYSDAIASIYRYHQQVAIESIFPICLAPERSDAVKTCAVDAIITICADAMRRPTQPGSPVLFKVVAHRLRKIFKSIASRTPELDGTDTPRPASSKPIGKRFTTDFSSREQLLLAIMALWRISVGFFCYGALADEGDYVSLIAEMSKLTSALEETVVRLSAIKTIVEFMVRSRMLREGDEFYWETRIFLPTASAALLNLNAIELMESRESNDDEKLSIRIVHSLLVSFSTLSAEVPKKPTAFGRLQSAFSLAEMAALTTMWSPQADIAFFSAATLRLTAESEQANRIASKDDFLSPADRVKRWNSYIELGDPTVVIIGRAAQQKRIRKLLRAAMSPYVVFIAVWEECYRKWEALNDVIKKTPTSEELLDGSLTNLSRVSATRRSSTDETQADWQNLTLYLAALGGCCASETFEGPTIDKLVDTRDLPARIKHTTRTPQAIIKQFISQAVDMLVADSVVTRDVIKEALGSELHPLLYPLLFAQLNTHITSIFERNMPAWEEHIFIFVEQCLTVFKSIFDRLDSPEETAHIGVDIGNLILLLARFLHHSGTGTLALRLKIKFCLLSDSMFSKREILLLRREMHVRNGFLDIVADWAFEVIQPAPEHEAQIRLQTDLDIACLRSSVVLLDGLQLQPIDGSSGMEESVHVQSRLFHRYLSFFRKALDRWRQGDQLVEDQTESSSISSSIFHRRGLPKDLPVLRELFIAGVTKLLASNMNAGLKHCLDMCYHEESRVRTIWVDVFARIIEQGAKFDVPNPISAGSRYSKLCEMVKAPDMLLALAICEHCPASDAEDMVQVLLNVFDTRASLVGLLKAVVDKEISITTTESALFRGNNLRIRLLTAFAKKHGYNYLREILAPLIKDIVSMPPDQSLEMDPSKLDSENDLKSNASNLERVTQNLLNSICASHESFPPIIREICYHISTSVAAIWPESKFVAVGGFIFLRFINPVIVSPEAVDVDLPSPSMRRPLVLITKIIQQLANNILFGKEQHMMVLNDFLTRNIRPLTHFTSDVVKMPIVAEDDSSDEWLGSTYDETDQMILHRFFDANTDKVGKDLLSVSVASHSQDPHPNVSGKPTWEALCATLVEMGEPMQIPKELLRSNQRSRFIELLNRNAHRNTDAVKDIFFETATTDEEATVYIISASRLNVETVDLDLLTVHIFRTLMAPDDHPFDLIVDCSAFPPSAEIPIQWFKYFLELTPYDIVKRLSHVYILNPNRLAQRFFRKLYHVISGFGSANTILATSSVNDLAFSAATKAAIPFAVGLEKEVKDEFPDVFVVEHHRNRLPVRLIIGATHLRIITKKPQPTFPGLQCKLTEVVPLADVDDVYNTASVNHFVIRRNRGGGTMFFSATARDAIVKAIRSARGRLKVDGPHDSVERPVYLGDLSATLLNIGLLNITQDDACLRGASYNLICAVSSALDYKDPQIIPVHGPFVPANPLALATQISERLAEHAPKVTLDFLTEFFVGYDKSDPPQKAACLHYLRPWIRNLSSFQNPTVAHYEPSGPKLRNAIRAMIEITINDKMLYPSIQQFVWREMGKLDIKVMNMTLDELFRAAIDAGVGSTRCEVVADTLVTMASINTKGKIIAKLRRVISKINQKPTRTLSENPVWNEVAAMTRLALVVLTNSAAPAQTLLFVPEIAHLITLLAATGPLSMRTSVYNIMVNVLQTLCISRPENEALRLRELLDKCPTPEVLSTFGLARPDFTSEFTSPDRGPDDISITALESITTLLLDIIVAGAPSTGLANAWRARWMSLVISTAFQLSPHIQSRSFIVLGTLASSDVDDDLLYQMLVAFKVALSGTNENDTTVVISMLRCIQKTVPGLPPNSRYLSQVFWLAVALIQSGYAALFTEAARLLQATIETLDSQKAFQDKNFATVLLEARAPLDERSAQLDRVLALSFHTSLSFSLASIMFKGIRNPQTKDAAASALFTLLRTSVPRNDGPPNPKQVVSSASLGFFVALLSVCVTPDACRNLLQSAGIGEDWWPILPKQDARERPLFLPSLRMLGVNDDKTALLVVSFAISMINSSPAHGAGPEREMLFHLLAEATVQYPKTIAICFESILDKVNEIHGSSNSAFLIEAAGKIFKAAMADPLWSVSPAESTSTLAGDSPGSRHLSALEEMGMHGLINNHQFLPQPRSIVVVKWIRELVNSVITE